MSNFCTNYSSQRDVLANSRRLDSRSSAIRDQAARTLKPHDRRRWLSEPIYGKGKNVAIEQGLSQKNICAEIYERNHMLLTMCEGSLEWPKKKIYSVWPHRCIHLRRGGFPAAVKRDDRGRPARAVFLHSQPFTISARYRQGGLRLCVRRVDSWLSQFRQ